MPAQIILASASPRRKELLAQIKVIAITYPVDVDETQYPDEKPLAYVQRLAAEKSALCAATLTTRLPVLAADTAVVIDDWIMGKPKNREDGLTMLAHLSGRTHQVYTAISLRGKQHWQAVSITEVTFRKLATYEMETYWHTGEPVDKAGCYAIQGLGGLFVESINGSFSGVVGLPLFEIAGLLAKQGIDLLL
ncbi:Maf family protein [Methyloglobulus sp.]|uniref:Maf family protein n=1 Tax=Methyloglobulus sp. TaxID=2518622 RepID=UPI00398A2D08